MAELTFAALTSNFIVFMAVGTGARSLARSEAGLPAARGAQALSLAAWAIVLGTATQMALVALRLHWLPEGLQHFVTGPWHLAQSLGILGIATAAAGLFLRAHRDDTCVDAASRYVAPSR